ncbi:serine hydrolase domain-containing protein [Algiphilus sp.]|uniref:serine hydrolase domain-containing protein n=1 Tax=Algiphilus sp. TaxID=1872431 RepID=UPI0025C72520|nr:serine hydrolase domain-containing protein [Algiphilus sp.]MCK5770618.1 beta-lactamase family protein [Algiphilus sp.]
MNPFPARHRAMLASGLIALLAACSPQDDMETDDRIAPPDEGALQAAARSVLENARNRNEIDGYALEIGTADDIYARISAGDVQSVDTQVAIASAGKPVSAAVLLNIIDEDRGSLRLNRLRLDEPIARWLDGTPAGNTAAAQEVTLRHLLNHTSGLEQQPDCVESELNGSTSLMACATEILEAGTRFTPGTRFAYGAGSYHVAGAVAEAYTGQSWQSLVDERIAAPLEVDLPYLPEDNPRIAGGILTSVADLGTFFRALLVRDDRLMGEADYSMLRTPQTDTNQGRLPNVTATGYSFGLWIEDPAELAEAGTAGPELSAPGLFGAVPWLDDDRGYYAVLLLRLSNYTTGLDLMRELRTEILARLP